MICFICGSTDHGPKNGFISITVCDGIKKNATTFVAEGAICWYCKRNFSRVKNLTVMTCVLKLVRTLLACE